jgi:hypothetical protein
MMDYKEIDYEDTSEITCPYCGYVYCDSWDYGESSDEIECGACEKMFSFESYTTVTYTSRKKDCGSHEFEIDHAHIQNDNWSYKDESTRETKGLPKDELHWLVVAKCKHCDVEIFDKKEIRLTDGEYEKHQTTRFSHENPCHITEYKGNEHLFKEAN